MNGQWLLDEALRLGWYLPALWAVKAGLGWVLYRRVRAMRARRAPAVLPERDI